MPRTQTRSSARRRRLARPDLVGLEARVAPSADVLPPSATAVLDDYTGNGTFTGQSSGAGGLSVRKFDYFPGGNIPYDERSVLEFDTLAVPASAVTGATLNLTCTSTTTPQTSTVQVYGYASGGTIGLADATAPGVLLGSVSPNSTSAYSVTLDLARLTSLIQQGTGHVALRLSGVPEDNVQFAGTAGPFAPPNLTLQVAPPTASVADVSVNEGDVAGFAVTLSRPMSTPLTVNYSAIPGTATANVDFIPVVGTVTFAPGQTSEPVGVPTVGEPVDDSGKTFYLQIYNAPASVNLGQAAGKATIVGVPNPRPGLGVGNASVVEGASGTTASATFVLTLSVAGQAPVTVNYATADGTAVAGADYTRTAGTLTFAPGQVSQSVTVPVIGDDAYGPDKTFTLNLSGLSANATLLAPAATGTIVNGKPMPAITLGDATLTKPASGQANAVFPLTLSRTSESPITVRWATADGSALAGADYTPYNQVLTIPAGVIATAIGVSAFGDTFTEGDETFTLALSQPTGATIARASATATIVDASPTSGTMTFTSESWGVAEDANAAGTFANFTPGGFSTATRRVTTTPAVEDRAIYEYDVSPVVAGVVSSVTFNFTVDATTSGTGPVGVDGFAGTGTAGQADATRAVTPLGSFVPGALGRQSITLDRAAVLALVGGSHFLGIRLDPAAPFVNAAIYGPRVGPADAPTLTFHADLPVVAGSVDQAVEDVPLNVPAPGVLAGSYRLPNTTLAAVVDQSTANGTLTLHPDGSFAYTPALHFHGTDRFTFHASDGTNSSNIATVTINVAQVNEPPLSAADAYSTPEDAPLSVAAPGVLANDSDPNGNPLSAAQATGPAHGTLALRPDGSFTYTPALHYRGTDTFTYVASDGFAASSPATVTITVTPVGHPPTAANLGYATPEGTTLAVAAPGVLSGAGDVDGNPLTAVLVAGPSHGTLAFHADGSFAYAPKPGYYGADAFTFRATDGTLSSAVATATIAVARDPRPPLGTPDAYVAYQGTALSVAAPGILANDSDPAGDPLHVVYVSGPSHGLLFLNPDGSFAYAAAPGFSGKDSFVYRPGDGQSVGAPTTVTITVKPYPVGTPDAYTVYQGNALIVAAPGILGNDVDASGDRLSVVFISGPSHGLLFLNPDGSYAYAAAPGFTGKDSFVYRPSDGKVVGNATTVTINVKPYPVGTPDAYTAYQGVALVVAAPGILGNDVDASGDRLSVVFISGPSHGLLFLNPDGSFAYAAAPGFTGKDSFVYRPSDGKVAGYLTTVTITVLPAPNRGLATARPSTATDAALADASLLAVPMVNEAALGEVAAAGPLNPGGRTRSGRTR